MSAPYAGDITPQAAWEILNKEPGALLVDVRTVPEWNFVGIPDLSSVGKEPLLVPWQIFPSMEVNAAFARHVQSVATDPNTPLLFLCRSGARSRAAAIAMTAKSFSRCYNIAGGFEGDMDQSRHRGQVSGWKAAGLPWIQT